jgi:hypothetical protein
MRGMMTAALAVFALMTGPPAFAQADEIIVTASRYQERFESETYRPPHVTLTRRADFVVSTLSIESDTRDLGGRRTELSQILGDLQNRARNASITVALIEESEDDSGETRVKPFTAALAQTLIRNGARPDTSQVQVLLRTRVQPEDTLDGVEARLDAFVRSLPKPGRISLSTSDPQLTLTDIAQYRAPIVTAITADAKRITDQLGPGYGVRLSGLESRIAWRRSSDLELMLYIPHNITFEPVRAN